MMQQAKARRKPGSGRVLVMGGGEAGSLVIREMYRHPEMNLVPVAVLDDDARLHGRSVHGVPVAGSTDDMASVAEEFDVTEVLIAMPSQAGKVIHRIVSAIREQCPGLPYRSVPGMYELLSGRASVNRIRNVEIDDLLGRAPVSLDAARISSYIKGRKVMITGAGGSIGSELVRQICRFVPSEVTLFGHGENSIYSLERE